MIRIISLSKLSLSPRNVRRATDEVADLQLKADIEARGLLQNLVVAPAKKPRGTYTVEAGGRRLRALSALAAEGKLDGDHEVCCLVLDGGPAAAQEAGLAENFQRLAMNPADECLAFGQLIDQGADVEGIARRFGLTVRFVEGRLRLASLAPVVFEALGSGEITLDVAKAYAATPDQERQAFVFEQLKGRYSGGSPDSIRRMMTQATVGATDRRARFVGEDTYVAAGGRIEWDLFSEETGQHWLDIALLERLASEKIEALAAQVARENGLAWVRPTLDSWIGYDRTAGLYRLVPERAPLTDEENARIEAAQAGVEELIGTLEDEDASSEQREQAEAKIAKLESEIESIANKPPLIEEAVKGKLGAFLLLDPQGQPRLESVFYSEEPLDAGGEREGDASADVPMPRGSSASGDVPVTGKDHEPDEAVVRLSQTLVDELAIQRRDILAVHLTADAALALDLAIFVMVDGDSAYASEKSGSSLSARPPYDPVTGFKTPDALATIARAKSIDELDRSWTSAATRAERFDAFRALPEEARAAWLGHGIARTLEASANVPGGRACPFHDHLGVLLGIDVAGWWRPTGANFFDRVPKSVTLAALEEVGGPSFAARYAKAKKAELSHSAERIFAGEFIGEVELKESALAWVPDAMRFTPAPIATVSAAPEEETPPWEDEPRREEDGSDLRAMEAEAAPVQPAEPSDAERAEHGSTEPAEGQESGGGGIAEAGEDPPKIIYEAA